MKFLTIPFLFGLLSFQAWSSSYVPMRDETLVDQSRFIATAKVLAVATGMSARAETRYSVRFEQKFKGDLPLEGVICVAGGLTDEGLGLKVFGAPHLQLGDDVLLFLERLGPGEYAIQQGMLGAFRRLETAQKAHAWRNLAEVRAVMLSDEQPDTSSKLRDWDRFLEWIGDRVSGLERVPDYFFPAPEGWRQLVRSKYTLNQQNGMRLRWNLFDGGGFASWFANESGQEGMSDGGFDAFQNAIEVWNQQARIDYRYAGKSQGNGGILQFDSENTLLFNDPNDEIPGTFDCGSGGTLAMSGFWFQVDVTEIFRGLPHLIILGGDIITQDGAGCVLGGHNDADGEEVFAHELGHTLGLGHSCGDDMSPVCQLGSGLDNALMRTLTHADGRGAVLANDDLTGILQLYPAKDSVPFEVQTKLVYPWVSFTGDFASRVIVNNRSDQVARLFISGRRIDGEAFFSTRDIAPGGFLDEQAGQLFPDLRPGPGLTIVVESDREEVYGNWVTFNRNTPTTMSPAQGIAARLGAEGVPKDLRSGSRILFGFLPVTAGFISAPVIVNVGHAPTQVSLRLLDKSGQAVGSPFEIQELEPFRPFAVTTGTLVTTDRDLQLIATAAQPLTGVNFVFNVQGEPAMGNIIVLEPAP